VCDSDDQACRNEPGSYSCVNPDGSIAKPFLPRRDEGSHIIFLIHFSLYIAVSVAHSSVIKLVFVYSDFQQILIETLVSCLVHQLT